MKAQRLSCLHQDELAATGCTLVAGAVTDATVCRLRLLSEPITGPGKRLPIMSPLVAEAAARSLELLRSLGKAFVPVRAVLFDKSVDRNWVVPWHQDRTIAVKERFNLPGYGPWSIKDGVVHVEPPFALLAAMLTIRLHLDDCPASNAPLIVALGSHTERVGAADAAMRAESLPRRHCLAQAGDIWVYSTPILHRSDRATLPDTRRVMQIDFAPPYLPRGLEWAD